MVCVGCQQRREMISRMARTIVFGGRKRKLARFSEDDGEKGDPAGLDQSTADTGAGAVIAGTDNHAGAAGKSVAGGASTGGGG